MKRPAVLHRACLEANRQRTEAVLVALRGALNAPYKRTFPERPDGKVSSFMTLGVEAFVVAKDNETAEWAALTEIRAGEVNADQVMKISAGRHGGISLAEDKIRIVAGGRRRRIIASALSMSPVFPTPSWRA